MFHRGSKGPKKSLKWKMESELESVHYFELDETERGKNQIYFHILFLRERACELAPLSTGEQATRTRA